MQGNVKIVTNFERHPSLSVKLSLLLPVGKAENTAVEIRHADQATHLYTQMLALTSPTSGGRSVGIVR
jgi:hypothetical protein